MSFSTLAISRFKVLGLRLPDFFAGGGGEFFIGAERGTFGFAVR
jgi:hypothetical protein